MGWAGLALALLRALPTLLALLKSMDDRARAASSRQDGYNDAVREQLERLRELHERDAATDEEAEKAHRAHPSDDEGFDKEFRRD